ncbi:Enoyl-CoA hydratase/carnithine racemase [Litoreibacter ascidiaceicola]|uniref:Enoyl-CoA hydratase domain-containing protein 3, mitochondrial n=1 Tax=Litoreibacter ascidiaceicola TaxID=1486859 RepID=A0A1M4VQE4_9RHOB|nr:enoyl-CoA hydratase [Litoreibacter ascidiaceicola]SHE71148.1 Enoyl-CoA hydratase/carnithine racemase [Litoreibacter ascidiaceicola]
MNDALVLRADEGAVARLTLNNPSKLNALSDAMLAALLSALDEVAEDKAIRVVILNGAGKVFCAGHDLKEMQAARSDQDNGRAAWLDLFARCSAVMARLQSLPQPVIAQAHGIATAAGCQLVATCDLAVAAEGTKFGVNGVNIGLFCSTPMVALSRNIHRKQAFEMLTTGEFIDAERAREVGLINRVATGDLAEETMKLAKTIAAKLGSAVRIGKQAFYEQAQMPVAEAYAYTGEVMAVNMALDDTDEGIKAFLEKRKPNWS